MVETARRDGPARLPWTDLADGSSAWGLLSDLDASDRGNEGAGPPATSREGFRVSAASGLHEW
eukprot:11528622-Alexandrium_andersonii.AAC.1